MQIANSNELILEILPGEGGGDSKSFSRQLFAAIRRFLVDAGCQVNLVSDSLGHFVATVSGKQMSGRQLFALVSPEIGVHCVQRIPPTETRNRRHTSYVSVAVMPIVNQSLPAIPSCEIEVKTQRGHGPGGQHQNKTDSAVRMIHRPTGTSVFMNGRDQHANRREALKVLTSRVHDAKLTDRNSGLHELRKSQLGDNGRGQKIRTYNYLDDRAVDHRTGKKASVKRVIDRGALGLLRD